VDWALGFGGLAPSSVEALPQQEVSKEQHDAGRAGRPAEGSLGVDAEHQQPKGHEGSVRGQLDAPQGAMPRPRELEIDGGQGVVQIQPQAARGFIPG